MFSKFKNWLFPTNKEVLNKKIENISDYEIAKTLEDFDQYLLDKYRWFENSFPSEDTKFIQRRFSEYGLFPEAAWRLIELGLEKALATKDSRYLYEVLTKFTQMTHANRKYLNKDGLSIDGYDFCGVVPIIIYSSLLGSSYIQQYFHASRPMSKNGYGAYKHTANIIIAIENSSWAHCEQAKEKSNVFISSKSHSKIDKAFVAFFYGLLIHDKELVMQSLISINSGYLSSGWGKHKPYSKPIFIQSLIAYSELQGKCVLNDEFKSSIVDVEWSQLWKQFSAMVEGENIRWHNFKDKLEFLNDLSL